MKDSSSLALACFAGIIINGAIASFLYSQSTKFNIMTFSYDVIDYRLFYISFFITLLIGVILCMFFYSESKKHSNQPLFQTCIFSIVLFISLYFLNWIFQLCVMMGAIAIVGSIWNNPKNESNQKRNSVEVYSNSKQSTTICWSCKTQYPFTKNPSGGTQVTCPKCGVKGVIK